LHSSHRLYPVHMAITGAAVEVIGADRQPHELLEQIELFVGTTAGNQPAEGLRAMRQLEPVGLSGHKLQRLLPCRFDQHTVPSDQRMGHSVGMARRMKSKIAPRAEVAVVPAPAMGAVYLDQLLVLGLNCNLATVAAEHADRVGALEHPRTVFVHRKAAGDGADGADLYAATAEFAVQGVGAKGLDLRHRASSDRCEGLHVHHFVAVADATQTLHATVHLCFDQRTKIFLLENTLGLGKSAGRGVLMGEVLEVASSTLVADRAIQRMIRQNEFEYRLMGVVHDRRGCS